MIRKLIGHVRLLFVLLVLASTAMAQNNDHPREGGLTGTGIMGLLNEAGIIEVSGLSITLPPDLAVWTPLGPKSVDTMQAGDMIAVHLDTTSPDLRAIEAQQVIQIIGPVAFQTTQTRNIAGTTIFNATTDSTATVGDWVAVNGYWREDGIIATRITIVPPQDTVHIQGTYHAKATGIGRIGETVITGPLPPSFAPGDVLRVTGRLADGALVVATLEPADFAGGMQTLITQGYQSIPDSSGFYTVLGTGISSVTQNPQMINPQELVTVCRVDGELVPNPVFVPENHVLCLQ